MRLLGTILLVVLSPTFATAAQSDDPKPDAKAIQGTWEAVEAKIDGKPAPEEMRKAVELKFDGEKLFLKTSMSPTQEASFKLDATKNPKTLDMIGVDDKVKGEKVLAIYELTGDKLRVCAPMTPNSPNRPTEFKSSRGSQVSLTVLKRVK